MDKAIYYAAVNDYSSLGLLVPANIAPKSGSACVFYCPGSTVWGSARQFNSPNNPWVGVPGFSTRITYAQRNEYWVWDGTTTNWNVQYPNARWDMDATTAAADVFVHPPSNKRPVFPRVASLNRRSGTALLTDLIDS